MSWNVLQDGSQALRVSASVVGQIADLRSHLSELAKTCPNLKEPVKNLTRLSFIGGGPGLVASTIGLPLVFGKHSRMIEATEKNLVGYHWYLGGGN